MSAPIRILLADDQALLRGTFRLLLDSTPDFEVVAEAGDGAAAVKLAQELCPDLVLMDIRMPVLDGLEATRLIAADPALGSVKVLILTTFEQDEYVAEALRAGAGGFLGKGVDPEELLRAIRIVAGGNSLLSPAATRALIARFLAQPSDTAPTVSAPLDALTARELEVVTLVATGLSNEEIAGQLFVTPLTAKTHVNRAMTKLGARDRAQVVVIAYESGLVRPGSGY
ncbi:two component transcriptional regulator, LuxR family [Catenulispora acidiphila DSM 44928]|uniref:Two component transcriptional regulator, LuxR family n=1 Tax=Catenulispora acidiphila (strain DSM 44928 / JCM 14897 / NBRC 102108 / NRRL B-24433 / ID139908) TaxID=479433 RepID=C7QEI0_CATAD|nr:response regulator transcription factor [Catenulispora acidiphila]ACU70871.1 two component transcriptional regulator, LuxR family [Catenulispora acidiphila DSM 44928]